MRAVLVVLALAGCAELGVVTDGSSISYGRPSRGHLIDGVKLPDTGDGFTTREMWSTRGNRWGTDELVTLIKNVSKRMKKHAKGTRLVVADLSARGGGPETKFHRSHQTGRDVDLLYYVRDAAGKPVEPDAMVPFDYYGRARDGSGMTVDVPRTWHLVRELLTAEEAYVQYIFVYAPIARMLIEHATKLGEDPVILTRATKALKQPGDSAPHNDHMHVRIYCPDTDRLFGCVDIGPLELLAERRAEKQQMIAAVAGALPGGEVIASAGPSEPPPGSAAAVWAQAAAADVPPALQPPAVASRSPEPAAPQSSASGGWSSPALATPASSASFGSLLRAGSDRIDFRGWR